MHPYNGLYSGAAGGVAMEKKLTPPPALRGTTQQQLQQILRYLQLLHRELMAGREKT